MFASVMLAHARAEPPRIRTAVRRRWILLRGWAREARHWGDFPEDLRAFDPHAEVVALDLPGAGRRNRERSPASVAGIVEACRAGTDRAFPLHLLGLSLGGMVGAEWARRYPGEVAAIVAINPSARRCPPWQRLKPRSYAALAGAMASADPRRREARALALLSRDPAAFPGLAERWAAYAQECPLAAGTAWRQLLAASRFEAGRPLPVPALVLASDGDRLVDTRCSRFLARRWNAALAIHPSAGHDIALDDGAWVAAQVRRWLGTGVSPD